MGCGAINVLVMLLERSCLGRGSVDFGSKAAIWCEDDTFGSRGRMSVGWGVFIKVVDGIRR